MTLKRILLAIILLLLFISVIKNARRKNQIGNFKKIIAKLLSLEPVLLFLLSFILVYFLQLDTGQGAIVLFKKIFITSVISIMWVLFYALLKEYKYNLIFWVVFIIYSLYIYASYISFGPVAKSQLFLYSFWFIQLATLYVILFDIFSKRVRYLSSVITGLFSCLIATPPLLFIFYKNKIKHPLLVGQLGAIWQTDFGESFKYFFSLRNIVAFTSLILLLFLLTIYQESIKPKSLTFGAVFTTMVATFILVNFSMYADLSIPKYVIKTKKFYGEEPKAYKNEQPQRLNVSEMASIGQSSRVIPHRVDGIGKLKRIIYEGSTGFEIDMIFQKDSFQVGHDEGTLSGLNLTRYLEIANANRITKMWFDTKNLNEKNAVLFKKELDRLDILYNLKSKIILESKTKSIVFSSFSKEGYHTSYYLPTQIRDLPEHVLHETAEMLAAQLERQAVRAVSFNVSLYPFVKEYLEKLISPEICYHMWDLSKSFNKPDLKKSLMSESYFHDKRIKTILIPFETDYDF
jgi:hypothetical protein